MKYESSGCKDSKTASAIHFLLSSSSESGEIEPETEAGLASKRWRKHQAYNCWLVTF